MAVLALNPIAARPQHSIPLPTPPYPSLKKTENDRWQCNLYARRRREHAWWGHWWGLLAVPTAVGLWTPSFNSPTVVTATAVLASMGCWRHGRGRIIVPAVVPWLAGFLHRPVAACVVPALGFRVGSMMNENNKPKKGAKGGGAGGGAEVAWLKSAKCDTEPAGNRREDACVTSSPASQSKLRMQQVATHTAGSNIQQYWA